MVSWGTVLVIVLVVGYVVYRMTPARGVKSIRPPEVRRLLAQEKQSCQFVDVREPREFKDAHVPGFRNIPLSQLSVRAGEIDTDRPVVLMCRSGARSMQAAKALRKRGYRDIRNASGGVMAWYAGNPK